jgi:hypothetical protein
LVRGVLQEIKIASVTKSTRPYLQCDIAGQTVRALYDTGADVSCVSQNCFEKLRAEGRIYEIQGTKPQFRSAGGQPLNVKGKTEIALQLEKDTIKHPFFVIDGLNEAMIIGIDFIQKHKLSYCPEKRNFHWQGKTTWD